MPSKPTLTDDDKALFLNAVADVKRLTVSKMVALPPSLPARKRKRHEEAIVYDYLSDYDKLPVVTSECPIEYKQSGISHKTLRNLRTGKYNAEATLDLHGLTSDEAKLTLQQFVAYCQQDALRYVLIIHGKGKRLSKPIIKNKLNHWLREMKEVLAFCSAAQKDGSTGAVYVVLKMSIRLR
jgi:DNA-nicking Smr family endonuclease